MIPEAHSRQFKYYDITTAIQRMTYKRLSKGASKENIINHLLKLRNETWKNSADIQEFIDGIIKEVQQCNCQE